ncbi:MULTISPECIES: hypothetical protein [unclassified Microcoleus]|uniref:hypothetical protein n=1 Tax=unclassified Microcoleus TaxID=2642155 RepID=UPI002FD5F6E1
MVVTQIASYIIKAAKVVVVGDRHKFRQRWESFATLALGLVECITTNRSFRPIPRFLASGVPSSQKSAKVDRQIGIGKQAIDIASS